MPGGVYNEPFLSFLERVNTADGGPPGPTVYSVSYSDWEPSVSDMYKARTEIEFAKLALRGMTVVVATGDGGVGGAQPLPSSSWPGHTCGATDTFIPDWPASSAWVTAVGAHGTNSAKSAALSGGGFSNTFGIPPWQAASVAAFHAAPGGARGVAQPPTWRYNSTGRGLPDLACAGENVEIVVNGHETVVSGTSASTPIFAALLADFNAKRAAAGIPALGFVNPLLYAHPEAFADITEGQTNAGCGDVGFAPVKGWDPITGLGAPKYGALLSVALCPTGREATCAA